MEHSENKIVKRAGLVYLMGFETLHSGKMRIYILHEIGILTSSTSEINVEGAREETCYLESDGMIDSQFLASELLLKDSLSCYYDKELETYYWVRSENLLKEVLKRTV